MKPTEVESNVARAGPGPD